MSPTLYAPSVPLFPEPLDVVRARRRAGQRNLRLAFLVRSPLTVGAYIVLAILLPFAMGWATDRAYYVAAALVFVTLWRAYFYFDTQLRARAFSAYETVDVEDVADCDRLLASIPEGAAFRFSVLSQGRFYTRLEHQQIRRRAEYLHAEQPATPLSEMPVDLHVNAD